MRAHPLIDPGYSSAAEDVEELIKGVEHIREVTRQPALREIVGKEITFGSDITSPAAMAAALRHNITTGHHPVSTCRIGPANDAGAMLDAEFRVRGIDALRVVDASAFPDQISGNPNAGIIMMAERTADFLLGRPQLTKE